MVFFTGQFRKKGGRLVWPDYLLFSVKPLQAGSFSALFNETVLPGEVIFPDLIANSINLFLLEVVKVHKQETASACADCSSTFKNSEKKYAAECTLYKFDLPV